MFHLHKIFPEGNVNWSYQMWQSRLCFFLKYQYFPFFLNIRMFYFESRFDFLFKVVLQFYNYSKHCFLIKYSENCDSEQKSSYHYNNVGGFGDEVLPVYFVLIAGFSARVFFFLAHFCSFREETIQQVVRQRVRAEFKTSGNAISH